jgi:hypothetical protein
VCPCVWRERGGHLRRPGPPRKVREFCHPYIFLSCSLVVTNPSEKLTCKLHNVILLLSLIVTWISFLSVQVLRLFRSAGWLLQHRLWCLHRNSMCHCDFQIQNFIPTCDLYWQMSQTRSQDKRTYSWVPMIWSCLLSHDTILIICKCKTDLSRFPTLIVNLERH